ncbi:MAG: type II toxin-antitoxin system RelE/ParE family toxin [Phycisphaerae bacterium]
MNATFIYTTPFTAWWREYRLDDETLRVLELAIQRNPEAGVVMAATGGLRKLRMADPRSGSGKSGGMRVCYAWLPEFEVVYMVIVFAKNVKANFDAQEKAEARALLAQMYMTLKKQRRHR